MSLELGRDLREAEARLDTLEVEALDVKGRLREAIEAGDVGLIIRLERRARTIDVELFAARARVLRARIDEVDRARQARIVGREAIEAELAAATKDYARAVEEADAKRIAMQMFQVKLHGHQSMIDSDREELNELNREIKELVGSRINRG
jgi:chromosome segregation ATPase